MHRYTITTLGKQKCWFDAQTLSSVFSLFYFHQLECAANVLQASPEYPAKHSHTPLSLLHLPNDVLNNNDNRQHMG